MRRASLLFALVNLAALACQSSEDPESEPTSPVDSPSGTPSSTQTGPAMTSPASSSPAASSSSPPAQPSETQPPVPTSQPTEPPGEPQGMGGMEGSAGGASTDEPAGGAGGAGGMDSGMSDAGEQGVGGAGVGGAASGVGGSDAAGGTLGAAGGFGAAGAGGAGEMPDAVAVATLMTTGVDPGHADISGSATFTQYGDEVTVVLELEGCPMGPHISHIHVNPDCGDEGNAAGAHWLPNGELLGDYTCEADGTASYTLTVDGGRWDIGGGDPNTDVVGRSFMVHLGSSVSPGDRVACGVIE